MADGFFSNLYGKRASNRSPLLGTGNIEEGVAGYSGLSLHAHTFWLGAGFTSTNRNVNAQTVSGGTLPLSLTLVNVVSGGSWVGVPMALTYAYVVPASGANRNLTFSVYGINQFSKPVREDVVFTNVATATTHRQQGNRVFARVDAVIVTSRSADAVAGDTLTIGNTLVSFTVPRIGTPIRIADLSDIYVAQISQWTNAVAGPLDATSDLRSLGLAVNIAEQWFSFSYGALDDTKVFSIAIQCKSSLGGVLGNNRLAGQKFIKPW